MDKPSKLNERLTLIANLSVVVGIVFLAVELRQNTQAIQAQTRDSITEKQMDFSSWIATDPVVADIHMRGRVGMEGLDPVEEQMFVMLLHGILREWENSYYQFERGLFTPDEFSARRERWRGVMARFSGYQQYWQQNREDFAPSFGAEVDRIVAEVGN